MNKKYFISFLFTLLLLITSCFDISIAQVDYPTRPIEAICPFPPGGSFDTVWRTLTDLAEKELRQKLVVVNRDGAGGMVALGYLSKSKPDGYTICQSALIKLAFYTEKLDYKEEDFIPIIQWGQSPNAVSVRADSPWKTMKDVVDYARANPGKLKVGHIGRTNTLYLVIMGLVRQQNIKVIDIPFKGDAPLLMSLLNKDVDVVSGGFLPYTNRDDVRVIMTCGENRMEAAPTVPTYKETFGIEPVVGLPTSVVFVPRGTPDIIIKRLHDSFRKAMEDKRFKDSMFKGGLPIAYKGTKEIQQFAIEERNRVLQSMKEEGMIK